MNLSEMRNDCRLLDTINRHTANSVKNSLYSSWSNGEKHMGLCLYSSTVIREWCHGILLCFSCGIVLLCFDMDFLTFFFIPISSSSQIYFVRMFFCQEKMFGAFINNRQTCVLQ